MKAYRVLQQDENDVAYLSHGKNMTAGTHTGFGNSKPLAAKTPGLTSGRKALGNITNWAGPAGAKTALPHKTPGRRKALGDITNATPARDAGHVTASKPAVKVQTLAPAAAPAPKDLAEVYAEGGVERLLGKGWAKIEEERKERKDAEIAARVKAITSRLPTLPRMFQVRECLRGQSYRNFEKEIVPPPPQDEELLDELDELAEELGLLDNRLTLVDLLPDLAPPLNQASDSQTESEEDMDAADSDDDLLSF